MPESPISTKLISVSEQIIGLILTGKQTATNFNPDRMWGEYGKILKDIKSGKTEEDLVLKYGNIIQPCKYAANSVNGMGTELDWVALLDKAYTQETIQDALGKMEKALGYGDDAKFHDLLRRVNETVSNSQRLRSVTADQISDDYVPFMKSGSRVWDEHIGGFPPVGVVLLGAKTFTGKTTIAINMMENFLKEYPERRIMFVTLEDMAEGWKERARVILGERSDAFWRRCVVMEFASSPDEIIQEASRYNDIGMIFIDYLELLVKEKDLSSYDKVYRSLSLGSKSLAVASPFRSMPICLLAQFSKGNYRGGVPTQEALFYTGEDKVYQTAMLYRPDGDFYSDNTNNPYTLPEVKGKAYIVFWKVKNGCRPHIDEFPGAIQTNWTSKQGYDLDYEHSEWMSLTSETKRRTGK